MNALLEKISALQMKPRKGVTAILGDEEHILASYSSAGNMLTLKNKEAVDSESLKSISRKASRMSLCFSPRGIYSDIGEFSCISKEATTAHIRSSVDKIGLFREDYCIAFTKIQDIDNLKSRYSYLAIASSEINRTELLDSDEAIVDVFCPIEASIAAAVNTVDKAMVIIIYQDTRVIRIIASKAGIIFYLITINASESFDVLADTMAGVKEMTSMLISSSQERVHNIYLIGKGDINTSDLETFDVKTVDFSIAEKGYSSAEEIVLYGTAMNPCYDFTHERLHKTKRIVMYAKMSFAFSAAMALISAVFLILGLANASGADADAKKIHAAISKSAKELKVLEDDYASLSKNLDLTNINNIVGKYKNSQAEPKLQTIVNTISYKVPENIFITRIEVARGAQQGNMPPQGTIQPADAARTTKVSSFDIVISGIINTPYPKSKEVFSSFMAALQQDLKITKGTFTHKDQAAEFSMNCGMKI